MGRASASSKRTEGATAHHAETKKRTREAPSTTLTDAGACSKRNRYPVGRAPNLARAGFPDADRVPSVRLTQRDRAGSARKLQDGLGQVLSCHAESLVSVPPLPKS